MKLTEWKNTGKYFDFKGRNIFYQENGKGETLVLVHGFPTSSWDWEKIWPKLSEKYNLLAPDLLGFGFSDKPTNHQYSIYHPVAILKPTLR